MNEVMILRRGGGNPFAVIGVEYPEGSTCTCTGKNGKVLTAKQSPWIFNIPGEDKWTVKIAKTENGKLVENEQTVVVDKRNQCYKLVMDFNLVMVYEGAAQVQFTAQAARGESKDGAYVVRSDASEGYGYMYIKTDLAKYSKLCFEGMTDGNVYESAKVFVGTTLAVDVLSDRCVTLDNERKPYEIDVSGLGGEHYVAIAPHNTVYDTDNVLYRYADAYIYNMRLE